MDFANRSFYTPSLAVCVQALVVIFAAILAVAVIGAFQVGAFAIGIYLTHVMYALHTYSL